MLSQIQIVRLPCCNVHRQLAAEELLLAQVTPGKLLLLLWRSDPAVVIGKNQNPWRECHLPSLRSDGVPLARRLSGGGTVWHDPGNLNYTFLLPRGSADFERQTQVVVAALARLGVTATRGPRHILVVGDRKISGNAFYYRQRAALHHGTLLFAADLRRMRRYLRPTIDGIDPRGIRSAPYPVVNLSEIQPGLDETLLADAMAAALSSVYGDCREIAVGDLIDPAAWHDASQRYASRAWLYERTPRFIVNWRYRTADGLHNLELAVRDGIIQSCSGVDSATEKALIGLPFGSGLTVADLDRLTSRQLSAQEVTIRRWLIGKLAPGIVDGLD